MSCCEQSFVQPSRAVKKCRLNVMDGAPTRWTSSQVTAGDSRLLDDPEEPRSGLAAAAAAARPQRQRGRRAARDWLA
jgi:hypothetical protein